jgi:hypothetical protein
VAMGDRRHLEEYVLCLDLCLRIGPVGNGHPEVMPLAPTPGSVALRLAKVSRRSSVKQRTN